MLGAALSHDRLLTVLHYEPSTGVLTWRVNAAHGSVKAGDVAGSLDRYGYGRVTIDRVMYRSHRVIWFYMTGEWPAADVDHKFNERSDNRWEFIRSVSKSVNSQNMRTARRGTKTGILGATPHKSGKFQSQIRVAGRSKYLGLFSTAEEAHQAYLNAKRELHEGCTL